MGLLTLLLASAPQVKPASTNANGEAVSADTSYLKLDTAKGRYTLKAINVPLKDLIDALQEQSDVKIKASPKLEKKTVHINTQRVKMDHLLNILSRFHGMECQREGNMYTLVPAKLSSKEDKHFIHSRHLSKEDEQAIIQCTRQIRQALATHRNVFAYTERLNSEDARLLALQRKAHIQGLADQLAAMDRCGARSVLDVYADEKLDTREKLFMVTVLREIDDEEAALALGGMYRSEDQFGILRMILGALAHRTEIQTENILAAVLEEEGDHRLRRAAVQAMSGRPGSLETLVTLMNSPEESRSVRQEAVRSIALIKNEHAHNALSQVAESRSDPFLRIAATTELVRSYGANAIPTLSRLLEDPDESIRGSTVMALSRIKTEPAIQLLHKVAKEDPSNEVRQRAQGYLKQCILDSAPIPVLPEP